MFAHIHTRSSIYLSFHHSSLRRSATYDYICKISVIGAAQVGKTSIVRRYYSDSYSYSYSIVWYSSTRIPIYLSIMFLRWFEGFFPSGYKPTVEVEFRYIVVVVVVSYICLENRFESLIYNWPISLMHHYSIPMLY